MTRIFDNKLTVSPFIIVPLALTEQEAVFVLRPKELDRKGTELIRRLYTRINENDFSCPLILQAFSYEGKMLLATTIQTQVRDARSGRLGAKLTYGVLVNREVFFYYSSVCNRVFEILDKFFQEEFSATASVTGADVIVTKFQQGGQLVDSLISQDKTDRLLARLESEFCVTDKDPPNLADKVRLFLTSIKIMQYEKFRPANTPFEARRFWAVVDTDLAMRKKTETQAVLLVAPMPQEQTHIRPTLGYQNLYSIVQTGILSAWRVAYFAVFLVPAQAMVDWAIRTWVHEAIDRVQALIFLHFMTALLAGLIILQIVERFLILSDLHRFVKFSLQNKSHQKGFAASKMRFYLAETVLIIMLAVTAVLFLVAATQLLLSIYDLISATG